MKNAGVVALFVPAIALAAGNLVPAQSRINVLLVTGRAIGITTGK